MNPRTLRALAEIVDQGSFSRAADALNVTQPTLSQSIKQLEALVGAPVLKRGRFGVSPTKVGEVLAREGRAIRTALAHAQEGLDQWRAGIDGQLKVGVGPMLAQTIIPTFIAQLLEQKWNTGLRIYTEGAHALVARVKSAELDLALAPARMKNAGEELASQVVIEDTVGVYVGIGHRLAKRQTVCTDDLEDLEWISSGQMFGPRDTTTVVAERLGLKRPRTVIDFSGDVSMPLRLVEHGRLAVIFPDFLMHYLPSGKRFVRLPTKIGAERRDIALWYRTDMDAHPSVTNFRDRFIAFLADLRKARGQQSL